MKFTIRDLLWLTAILAILVAAFLERGRLVGHYEWLLRYEHDKRIQAEQEVQVKKAEDKRIESYLQRHINDTR